ncbi:MAG TPA: hypothetical protein VK157_15710 [Phycisphaerales bacterium]|nr:hypothetical protein [Phycisphaerales bacterium]
MQPWIVVLLLVGIMLPIEIAVVYALLRGPVQDVFNRLHAKYPPQQIGDGAIRRNFQSAKKDIVNLGFCVHFAVDDQFVHVMPAAVLRWAGAKGSSVPVDVVSAKQSDMSYAEIVFDDVTLVGPTWVVREAANRLRRYPVSA